MSRATARAVLSSFTATPSYLHAGYDQIGADLECLAAVDYAQEQTAAAARSLKLVSAYGGTVSDATSKPFAYFDGNAVIPVHGLLINRFAYSWSFITGYNFISDQLAAAVADDDVKTIVLDINSYGGTCAGNQEIADQIFAARSVKPILAVVDAAAHSAAYHIASQATKIVITPSGMCGSIGCVCAHTDITGMLEKDGIKVTLIYKGAHKVDSYSEVALSDEASARMEAVCAYYYGIFCNNVARGRGIDVEAVEATEAQTYVADEALKLNLVDSIAVPAQALTDFYNDEDGSDDDDSDEEPILPTEKGTQMTEAEMQAAITAAADTAHARVTGILNCDEAKDRPKLAASLAGRRDVSLETARAILADAAKETAPVATTTTTTTATTGNDAANAAAVLDAAMNKTPVIVPGADTTDQTTTETKPANTLLSSLHNRVAPIKARAERKVLTIGQGR